MSWTAARDFRWIFRSTEARSKAALIAGSTLVFNPTIPVCIVGGAIGSAIGVGTNSCFRAVWFIGFFSFCF